MPAWPFKRDPADVDAERLQAAVSQIARQPNFYGEGRMPDTLDGRLEALMLHGGLVMIRLRREPALAPLAQAFADQLFRHIDAGLREAGVGDMAVPKRMHKIASAFYGRLEAYAAAVDAEDGAALADALARNALGASSETAPFAAALAAYVLETVRKQGANPAEALSRLDGWASAPT